MMTIFRDKWLLAALLFVALVVLLSTSLAQSEGHERARALQNAGEILSLETILDRHGSIRNGRVLLEAELEEQEGDGYVYEIEMLDEKGRVWKHTFDARSGDALDDHDYHN